jgi:hypothetical protein
LWKDFNTINLCPTLVERNYTDSDFSTKVKKPEGGDKLGI